MKSSIEESRRPTVAGNARPTQAQVAWADAEFGVIIHLDLQVFEKQYDYRRNWGRVPDARVFDPSRLNTDQWLEAAASAGARYAVLVAKHCSGFCLWPTNVHDYHVGNTPWKDGKGDVVADFMRSCRQYGIKPGLYYSTAFNGFYRVDNPGRVLSRDPDFLARYNASLELQNGRGSIWAPKKEQERYRRVVEAQLEELWSRYGPLFEIWFDGGVLLPEEGGPEVLPLMQRLQPDAVAFLGPEGWPSRARFIGNERGDTPDPFWSTVTRMGAFDGTEEVAGLGGQPGGEIWAGGEACMPNRHQLKAFQGGWFWRPGDDRHLYSIEHLVECYFSTVGRNANWLLGMVIDDRGMVPDADRAQFAALGRRLKAIFADRVASARGRGAVLELPVDPGRPVDMVVLQEDIAQGERVRRYAVDARLDGRWIPVCRGTCIGHKRIERMDPLRTEALRLRVLESAGEPRIRELSAWYADPALFSVPLDPVRRNVPRIIRDRNGLVQISTRSPGLNIRYTVDGSEPDEGSPLYERPFPLPGGSTVKAVAFVNERSHSQTATAVFGIDRGDWRILTVSLNSPFKRDGHADVSHLLNDDPAYFWHTYHTDRTLSAPPHEVVFDMGRSLDVRGFTLMPASPIAAPDRVEFELSDDGETWTPALQTALPDVQTNAGMQWLPLSSPRSGRYLRFVARHAADDADYVLLAGIGVVV